MSFESAISPLEHVYDDSYSQPMDHRPDKSYETGLELPSNHVTGEGYEGVAEPFPSSLLIPRSEWQARIEEKETLKNRLSDYITRAQLPCKNQQSIPYCWIFGPVGCCEVIRLLQNQEYKSLSPASAGAPIKNFRKVGGWGKEGLQWVADKGVNESKDWPDTAVDRQYYTEESKAKALLNRTTEWWVLRNIEEVISAILLNIPVAVGLSWWSHEIYYSDAVWKDGAIAVRYRNSWGASFSDNGFAILQGSKMLPDDAVAPRVMIA